MTAPIGDVPRLTPREEIVMLRAYDREQAAQDTLGRNACHFADLADEMERIANPRPSLRMWGHALMWAGVFWGFVLLAAVAYADAKQRSDADWAVAPERAAW